MLLALALLLGARAAGAADRAYPLTLTPGSRILVTARINGHPVEALLDSAAESTLIDSATARAWHLEQAQSTVGHGSGAADVDMQMLPGVTLEAFGLKLPGQTVAATDLEDVGRRLLGRPLQVILGREVFDAARLRIDLRQRTIRVVPRDVAPEGERLMLTTEHGVETLPVGVEGLRDIPATFDLGNAAHVLVSRQLAARLNAFSDGRRIGVETGGGLGGATQRQVFTLRSLTVAGQSFTDLAAAVDAHDNASDLNIGLTVLSHFLITTDFAQHAVWLRPQP